MKKILFFLFIVIVVIGGVAAWMVFGSATDFNENKKYLLVYTGKSDEASVMTFVKEHELLKHPALFNWVADKMGVWKRLKPGKFEIKKGESILSITRMLRNNKQTASKLVINKLRTKG